MRKWMIGLIVLLAFGAGVGAGVIGILYGTGGTSEPSKDTDEAITRLSLDGPTPTLSSIQMLSEVNDKVDGLATEVAALSIVIDQQNAQMATVVAGGISPTDDTATVTPAPTTAPTLIPTDDTTENPDNEATTNTNDLPERGLFQMDTELSEARFKIDENLAGNAIEVVGTTRQVAGDIIINYQNPSLSTVGQFAINARTFRTDNDFRNQAIRSQILDTDEYEFIFFQPTELLNLPTEPVTIGSEIQFEIRGDLTIKDVTHSVVFDVTLTAVSLDQIEAIATTQVLYADFGIGINPPPTVSDIGDSVTLEIDFVANVVEQQ